MHPAFQTLLVLQDRDKYLDQVRKDLEDLPRLRKRELDKLADDQEAVANAKSALQENRIATDRLELDIKTRKNSLERLRNQQFETRKNDEFTALGHEIKRYEADVSALEDQELALWEVAETLQAALTAAEDLLERHRRGIDEDIAKLDERVIHLEARRVELDAERHVLAKELDESLLARYQSMRQRKADPVVEVSGGTCNGCHMKVPRGTEIAASSSDQLLECPNCGRFLYSLEIQD